MLSSACCHLPLLSYACCFTPVVSGVGFSPLPPAPSALRTIQPTYNGLQMLIGIPISPPPHFPISPFPHFHIPILPHYIRFGLWLWLWFGLWFGFGFLSCELWLSEARRKSRPLGRRAGFPFARRNEREKKPLARRARAREVHSLSLTAVGGGPTGFPLASPNARPPLPPDPPRHRARLVHTLAESSLPRRGGPRWLVRVPRYA